MSNRQIVRHILMFRDARKGWANSAVNLDSVQAASMILSINSKIELLLTMWDFSDDSVDFPYAS